MSASVELPEIAPCMGEWFLLNLRESWPRLEELFDNRSRLVAIPEGKV